MKGGVRVAVKGLNGGVRGLMGAVKGGVKVAVKGLNGGLNGGSERGCESGSERVKWLVG